MKKRVIYFLLAVFIISVMPFNYAVAANLNNKEDNSAQYESKSLILLEAASGEVLYAQNIDERRIPASVTKLMTLLIINEAVNNGEADWQDIITASENAAKMGGTQIFLAEGEKMSLKDLTIAIAVGSANDATVAVSEYLASSEDAFVAKMNTKAAMLGMINTHFANSNGLPAENHYTTASDLAILAREIVNNYPQILEYTSIKHYTLRENSKKPFILDNKNKLLWWYEGTDGLKTGWIGAESGYNVVATAKRDSMRLIVVALGSEKTYGNFRDAIKLFDRGFNHYQYHMLYNKDEVIADCRIEKGEKLSVPAITKENIGYLTKDNQDNFTTEISWSDLCAPIEQGAEIGELKIYNAGVLVRTYPLYATESREKYGFFQALARMSYYLLS